MRQSRLMRGTHTAYALNTHGLCGERTRLMRGARTAYAGSAHGLWRKVRIVDGGT